MAIEMFSWPRLHERMFQMWGSNSGPLACQANSLSIELPRPVPYFCSILLEKKVFPDRNTPNAIQNSRLEILVLYLFSNTIKWTSTLLEKVMSPIEWERWKCCTEIIRMSRHQNVCKRHRLSPWTFFLQIWVWLWCLHVFFWLSGTRMARCIWLVTFGHVWPWSRHFIRLGFGLISLVTILDISLKFQSNTNMNGEKKAPWHSELKQHHQ